MSDAKTATKKESSKKEPVKKEAGTKGAKTPRISIALLREGVEKGQLRASLPSFRVGDTVKVHAKIREGGKERIQIFEGLVIKRFSGVHSTATFTVRKISYNVGVERTFFVHSPMIDKIEVVSAGNVRRARLYYLRDLRGKSARIKSKMVNSADQQMDIKAPETEASSA